MISIVIPVYNSSSFLHKTVEAIDRVRQTHWKNEKFELVLTDDGSKDGSFEVIKKLAEKYPYYWVLNYLETLVIKSLSKLDLLIVLEIILLLLMMICKIAHLFYLVFLNI